ncbi:ABC transporter ATP-binding protein/permease [Staphylococcus hyicus]|uniref:ABC transporter ATP-binding protein n=1 Tax=Staphylococcus hyicus TaxID=1284 RepID=UPI00211CB3E9|nr:ABC transporter ATP-binding protein [Staphylococcus hyicus]MCQ9292181.1 ABC transporter ATP-binding protein/permease [Staphylococcus hyicus]MCQ9307422.1 ABC transporter ATP-binding protein/permease [Staphylococcus hyicus]MCQ9309835.1 ABC transporter ATP-binding protein/permease [Staphylococcus hyicus]MCQ9312257.1 ABC transporter ATP-binding protein/permease [Staphylococcus hyicus]
MDKFTLKNFFQTILTIPKTIRLIFRIERKYASYLIILNILQSIIPLASLFIYQELINAVLKKGSNIFSVLIVYILMQMMLSILSQLNSYISEKFNMNLSYNLNLKLLKKTSSLNLIDFEQADTYNLIENIVQDSTYKPFQLFNAIIGVITGFLSLLTSIIYVSTWNVAVSTFLLIIPVISLVIFMRVGQLEFLIQWERANSEREVWYINYLLTHDFSFKEIKLNGISQYFIDKYGTLKRNFMNQDLNISKKKVLFRGSLDILLNFINGIAIFMMIQSIRSGKLLVGNFVSLIQAITRVNTYSQSMIQNTYIIYNTSLFMEQLFKFFDMEVSNISIQNSRISRIEKRIDKIKVNNLSFIYPGSVKKTLEDINVEFNKGELVAIVGKNGSGKSTLVKLLSGLYQPSEGQIYYNNESSDVLDLSYYQNNVSVLFQDFVKFELSVRENIGLSDVNSISDSKIKKHIDNLKLNFLTAENNFNLNQRLGAWFNDSRQISGGQWQKVALARTFFKNASIYILDEPSSALDPVSEKEIFDEFVTRSRDKIALFVSHNLMAASRADRIIVMQDGRIIDEGKHDDLISKSKYYRELYYSEKYEEESDG